MIDACQDWAERSRMRINHEKTEVTMFYETPSQRTTRLPSTFHICTRFPLSQPPQTLPLKEPLTFKCLGLTYAGKSILYIKQSQLLPTACDMTPQP